MGLTKPTRWRVYALLGTVVASYGLGWHQGRVGALKTALKVYKQQVWNEHGAVMRDEKNWKGGLR